jgi:hypothetical protein
VIIIIGGNDIDDFVGIKLNEDPNEIIALNYFFMFGDRHSQNNNDTDSNDNDQQQSAASVKPKKKKANLSTFPYIKLDKLIIKAKMYILEILQVIINPKLRPHIHFHAK